MIIIFQNLRSIKEFLGLFWVVLGYLPKLKRGLGLAYFLHVFSYNCSFSSTISVDKVAMPNLFPFPRYQIKWVVKFLCRQLMTSHALRFTCNQPLKQWPRTGYDGSQKYRYFNILRAKTVFRCNKKHFSWLFKGYHLLNKRKRLNTSFKLS